MSPTDRPASALPGVRYGSVVRLGDARGSFREVWRASDRAALSAERAGTADERFVQANLSTSTPGVLRGLHCHRRQLDRWVVVGGLAFVALVDIRAAVAGTGSAVVETRELPADDFVEIPAGVAHGFLAIEALELLYLVTNEFDGSDELGFAWDDPSVGVPWPSVCGTPEGRPILSDRDRSNRPLSELIARLRQ